MSNTDLTPKNKERKKRARDRMGEWEEQSAKRIREWKEQLVQ
jgi:hypothetical protein